jgi:hypothetical protein
MGDGVGPGKDRVAMTVDQVRFGEFAGHCREDLGAAVPGVAPAGEFSRFAAVATTPANTVYRAQP